MIAWREKNLGRADDDAKTSILKEKIVECEEYIQKAVKWEAYVLDTRIGMKITTAVETLRTFKLENGL